MNRQRDQVSGTEPQLVNGPGTTWRWLLAAFAFIPLACLCGGPFMTVKVWSGRFLLYVEFVNDTGKDIQRIEGADAGKREDADWYVSHPAPYEQPAWKPIEINAQGVGQVPVRCYGREDNLIGHEWAYGHFKAVAFRVEFTDGSCSRFAADVPTDPKVRDISLRIPLPQSEIDPSAPN